MRCAGSATSIRSSRSLHSSDALICGGKLYSTFRMRCTTVTVHCLAGFCRVGSKKTFLDVAVSVWPGQGRTAQWHGQGRGGQSQGQCRAGEGRDLQHDMHLPGGLQILILRPAKGIGSCQHDVQHHPTRPHICNLQAQQPRSVLVIWSSQACLLQHSIEVWTHCTVHTLTSACIELTCRTC